VILVDTHVVVWVAGDPQKLSSKARAAIDQELRAGQALAISCMTLFELAHLLARGRFRTTLSIDAYLMEIESRFVVLPLSRQIAARTVELPNHYPNDPMDRIIGATAIVEGLPLVTADVQIQQSKAVKTIW